MALAKGSTAVVRQGGDCMRYELKRIEPVSVLKVMAVLYGLLGLIFGLIFGFIGGVAAREAVPAALGFVGGPLAGLIFGIFYGVMGGLFGAIGAFFYNLVAGWVGGIEVKLEQKD